MNVTDLVTIPDRTSSTLRLSRSPGWYMRSTRESLSSVVISRTGRGKYDTPTSPYITQKEISDCVSPFSNVNFHHAHLG